MPQKPTIKKKAKNPAAVALGRLGGLKGGKARAKALSPRRRKIIAKKAAIARWRGTVVKAGKRVRKPAGKKGKKK
jgi:hypothetical protein